MDILHRRLHFRRWTPVLTTISGKLPTAWWDASGITGLSDGTAVSSWADSAGGTYTAVQATTTKKPIFKTNIVNGLPAVLFNGANAQVMVTPNAIAASTINIFSVVNSSTASALIIGHSINNTQFTCNSAGTNAIRTYDGIGSGNGTSTILTQNNSTFRMLGVMMQSSNNTFIENGASRGTVSKPVATTYYNSIGGFAFNQYLSGYIAEILVYTSILSLLDIAQINKYLCNKYGLTIL